MAGAAWALLLAGAAFVAGTEAATAVLLAEAGADAGCAAAVVVWRSWARVEVRDTGAACFRVASAPAAEVWAVAEAVPAWTVVAESEPASNCRDAVAGAVSGVPVSTASVVAVSVSGAWAAGPLTSPARLPASD